MQSSIKITRLLALLFGLTLLSVTVALAQSESIVFLPIVQNGGSGISTPVATLVATPTTTPTTPLSSATLTAEALTATSVAQATPTPTASQTLTPEPTATVSHTPTATTAPSGTPTATTSSTATPTNIATATSTATPTPTSTPTATDTATATATSTATSTSTPDAVILANDTWFSDSIGNLHIVGQVENRGTTNIQFAKVTANVFNASNQLIGVDFTYTLLTVVPPGQRACYHIIMDEPSNWTRYELEGAYVSGGIIAPSLVALNVTTGTDPTGVPEILGQVRNDGSSRARFVQAVGTLFNNSDFVIGCDSAYVSSTDLNAGQSSSFRISFFPRIYPPISSFSLQVHGNPE